MKVEMSEAARAARAEYNRAWRARNPDRAAASTRRYWERRAAAMHTAIADSLHRTNEAQTEAPKE